jgi:hypothetical protein
MKEKMKYIIVLSILLTGCVATVHETHRPYYRHSPHNWHHNYHHNWHEHDEHRR